MSELVYYEKNTYSIQMPESFEGIYLVQLADITAKADWCVESHEQFCHEVLLVFEGELSMRVNERRIRLAAGQMAVIAEGATHEIDPGGSARVRLGVLGIRLNRSAEPRFGAFFSVAPEQVMGYTPNQRMLFEMMADEYFNRDQQYRSMLGCILYAFTVSVCRHGTGGRREPLMALRINSAADSLAVQMSAWIREHAAQITSIEEISEAFSYSYSHLSHHFKRQTGYALKEYWNHYRFQAVFEMMRDPALSLTQIADRVHFQSIHTFSRAFTERFGIAPSKYRRIILPEEPREG